MTEKEALVEKIAEFVREIAPIWQILVVASFLSGTLIFNALNLVKKLGLDEFVSEYRTALFLVFLTSSALLFVRVGVWGFESLRMVLGSMLQCYGLSKIVLSEQARVVLVFMGRQAPDGLRLNRQLPYVRELRREALIELAAVPLYVIDDSDFDIY